MLVELNLVEQRYRAVIDVLDGMSVTDVAQRNGVSRQSVHTWLRRYANGGLAALADKSSKPETCPHQMAPLIEAKVVELRRAHPRWGPTIDPHPARQRRVHSGPWTLVDLSHPGPSPPLRTDATQALALGLQALGALSLHGAVADGRRRALPSSRRHRGQGRHRRRRPLTLLRLRPRGRPGHGETGVRGLAVGAAHPWCARPDPDRQRQGFHGSLRPRARTCPFRPDLRQQRHPSSPHRSVFTDDNGQGRTLPQDHALGLLGRPRPGARDHRGAPKRSRRMGGRIQHRTSAPVSGRSTTPRALRSGCAPSGRSRDARGPRRGSALKAATRSQPLGRPARLDRPRRVPLSGGSDLRRGVRRGRGALRPRRDPPQRCARRYPRRASPGGQRIEATTRPACRTLPAAHFRHDRHPPRGRKAARSPSPVPAIGLDAAGPARSSRWPSWPVRSRSPPRARSSGSTPSITTAPRSTAPSPRLKVGPAKPRSPEG